MLNVFISYSHKQEDERWKDRLLTMLQPAIRKQQITAWHDRQIETGERWEEDILAAIAKADVAVLLITADFLASEYITETEVPAMLEHYNAGSLRLFPVIVRPCLWQEEEFIAEIQGATKDNLALTALETDHEREAALVNIAQQLLALAKQIAQPQQNNKQPFSNSATRSSPTILIDQLPTVAGDFVGREAELQLLDDAFKSSSTNILQFIAAGGTGKTKLLRHWLNNKQAAGAINNRIIWSFYSQGTTDTKQVSASPLFEAGFKEFDIGLGQFKTDEDRADAFADAVIQHQCLLVLDGLEPMQHGGRGMDGRLKDRAMIRLLKRLVNQNSANSPLCVITSRIPVYELTDRVQSGLAIRKDLSNLETNDGIQLLRAYQLQGRDSQLKALVEKVKGHALTLHLLGNAIHCQLDDELQKLDTLTDWFSDTSNTDRHAFRVMQQYDIWLRDEQGNPEPELWLLYLLGLFDHPIEKEVLQVLWNQQIPELTQGIHKAQWKTAITSLQDTHRLLSFHLPEHSQAQHPEQTHLLDCHPLIREYFGNKLKTQHPNAWQQAHTTLYEFYKHLPDKEQPDSVNEMRPLFAAVAHGCAAGLHQQALEEVYWPRIKRKNQHYLTKKLGAFSDDLAVVAHFFTHPWQQPAQGLTPDNKAVVLSWAGFQLRALGRLREALEPMQAGLEIQATQQDWNSAASAAGNLSELQLTLGDISSAINSGQQAVNYAELSEDVFLEMAMSTTHADALAQVGDYAQALELFQQAEQLQQKRQPEYPGLYSLQGFQYCDLLLEQAKGQLNSKARNKEIQAVIQRATQTLEWAKGQGTLLLTIALDQLTLARAYLALEPVQLTGTERWIQQAVDGLRKAGQEHYLPSGLLTRSAFFRLSGDFVKAQQDLDEVFEIAEPSGMRLFLTDYHLESVRLGQAAGWDTETIQPHIQQTDRLIQATGYHRRDEELGELKTKYQELGISEF